jgi:hypothetical protein
MPPPGRIDNGHLGSGDSINDLNSANTASFVKVADAMLT